MHMNVFFRTLLFSSLISLSLICEANAKITVSDNWIAGLGAGGTFPHTQNSIIRVPNGSLVVTPYNLDAFSISNPSTAITVDIFGGFLWHRENPYLPFSSLSLHYSHLFDSTIEGNIQEYGLPLFTNYNYSLKLQSDVVDIVGKLDLAQYNLILPYFSVGVGVAANQLSNYKETPIFSVYPGRISPDYNSHTTTNFTYSFGAGFDFIYAENGWFTFGYQFRDLGTVNSGFGSDTWSSTKLNFRKLIYQTISLTLTYLFN